MLFRISFALAALAFVSISLQAQDEKPAAKLKPEGTPHVYKKVEGRELRVYVMNPPEWKATDQRPAIVWYHGGGWEKGKGAPTQFNFQNRYLITRGLVCLQVEYRLIENNRKEAPIAPSMDAKSAMRWVRSHAAELGIDPNRIASGGGSAGGHLAAFVGMVEGTDDPQDDLSIPAKSNAMLLYNPALLSDETYADQPAEDRRGTVTPELRGQYAKISPFLSVSADDPPGIILVGSLDPILSPLLLKAFRAKCEAAKVRMEAVVYSGEGHSFFGLSRSQDRFFETTLESDKFLASLGWIQGAPTLTREQVTAWGVEHPEETRKGAKVER